MFQLSHEGFCKDSWSVVNVCFFKRLFGKNGSILIRRVIENCNSVLILLSSRQDTCVVVIFVVADLSLF